MTSRARQPLRRVLDGRFELIEDDEPLPKFKTWGIARDRETGRIVRVHPRWRRLAWRHYVEVESLARELAKLGLPWIVPVLHAGPGIVYAEPPPLTPRVQMPREAAAACTLAACEVLAHLHALGVTTRTASTSFSPVDLRVDGEHARIAWFIPRIAGPEDERRSDEDTREWLEDLDLAPIAADLRGLVRLFFKLCPDALAEPVASDPQRVALDTLVELRADRPLSRTYGSAASIARVIASLAPVDRAARIVGLPVVDTLPPRRLDYDAVIADGEAELALDYVDEVALDWDFKGERDGDEYIAVPLATAYHQRACGAFARGDLSAALADVERARQLDDYPPYRTTLAAVLDASQRGSEARAIIASTVADWPSRRHWDPPPGIEHARAHAMRGAFALRDGDLALAESDLRRACVLHPTAAYAHLLGAALYARDNLVGAFAAESRSVELAPDNPRYRWALAVTLHELGRVNEARVHAREAVARDPAYRERLIRRFGRP